MSASFTQDASNYKRASGARQLVIVEEDTESSCLKMAALLVIAQPASGLNSPAVLLFLHASDRVQIQIDRLLEEVKQAAT
jgi:hypothetical protein